MREVLLIDVALWGALIMLAALIIIRRWRRSHSRAPARGPRREAPELTGQKMSAPRAASMTRPGQDGRAPGGAAPKPVRLPPPAAPPQATQMTHPKTRPRRPGAQRDRRQASAKAATPSERIASYYDHADQPIADYLAALGWTKQPPTPSVRQHAQIRIPQQRPPAARPAP